MSARFGKDLCAVLGLDGRMIKELTISCKAGSPTEVRTVEFLIKPSVNVETISRTFDLVEREQYDPDSVMYGLERTDDEKN